MSSATNAASSKKKVAWYNRGHLKVAKGGLLDNRYKIFKQKGKGAFSKVLECHDMHSPVASSPSKSGAPQKYAKVAIKILRLDQNKYAKEEITILKHVRVSQATSGQDAKCIRLLRAFRYKAHYCMVFPVYPMCLKTFLDKQPNEQGLPMRLIKKITFDLLTAIEFLHRNQIVHTDIKLENILMKNSDEGDISLIDFGSATYEYDEHEEIITTSHYRAPEVIMGIGWSYPVDLWAIGCIMFELLCGDLMFNPKNNAEHLGTIEHYLGEIPKEMGQHTAGKQRAFFDSQGRLLWPQIATKKSHVRYVESLDSIETEILLAERYNGATKEESGLFYDLLLKLLTIDPEKRITANEGLRHEFLAGEKERDDLRRRAAMKDKLIKASEMAPSPRLQRKLAERGAEGHDTLLARAAAPVDGVVKSSRVTPLKDVPNDTPKSSAGGTKPTLSMTHLSKASVTALRRSSEPVDLSQLEAHLNMRPKALLLNEDDKLNQLLDKNVIEESQQVVEDDDEPLTGDSSTSSALNETTQESDLLMHRDGTVEINWESDGEDSEDEDDDESTSSKRSSVPTSEDSAAKTTSKRVARGANGNIAASSAIPRRSSTAMDVLPPKYSGSTSTATTREPPLKRTHNIPTSQSTTSTAASRMLHSAMGIHTAKDLKTSPYSPAKSSTSSRDSLQNPIRSKKIKNKHRKPNHRTPALTSVKKHLRTKKKKKIAVRRRVGGTSANTSGILGIPASPASNSLALVGTAARQSPVSDPHRILKSPIPKVPRVSTRLAGSFRTTSGASTVGTPTSGTRNGVTTLNGTGIGLSGSTTPTTKPKSSTLTDSGSKLNTSSRTLATRTIKSSTTSTSTKYKHVGARVNTGRRSHLNSARSSDVHSQSSEGSFKPQPFMVKRPKVVRTAATKATSGAIGAVKQAWGSSGTASASFKRDNPSAGASSSNSSVGSSGRPSTRAKGTTLATAKSTNLKRASQPAVVLKSHDYRTSPTSGVASSSRSTGGALRRSSHVI